MFVPGRVLREDFTLSQSVSVMTNHFANSLTSLCYRFFFLLFLYFRGHWGLNVLCLRRRSDVTEEYIWIHLALQAICSLLPGFPPHKFCLTADFHSARSEGCLVTSEDLPDWLPRRLSLKWNVHYAASPALFFGSFFCFTLWFLLEHLNGANISVAFFMSSSVN